MLKTSKTLPDLEDFLIQFGGALLNKTGWVYYMMEEEKLIGFIYATIQKASGFVWYFYSTGTKKQTAQMVIAMRDDAKVRGVKTIRTFGYRCPKTYERKFKFKQVGTILEYQV